MKGGDGRPRPRQHDTSVILVLLSLPGRSQALIQYINDGIRQLFISVFVLEAVKLSSG